MLFPIEHDIKQLHKKYAKSDSVFELVYTHCQIVSEIAEQIIKNKNLTVDSHFIHLACLVHDIGAYSFIDAKGRFDEKNYIRHGIEGAKILREAGFDDSFVRIAERHTGVGITKEDIMKDSLPVPLKDYVAETTEERLVMYADKFHSKNPCFNSFSWYCNYVSRFGEDKVLKFQKLSDECGIPDLTMLAKKYNMSIKE